MTFVPITWVRLYGELNDLVPAPQRQRAMPRRWDVSPSVKDLIEGLGVPHTEVALLLANGCPVGFGYRAQDGDRIAAYPPFRTLDVSAITRVRPEPLPEQRFVADGHLGALARHLRMLGFDTAYWRDRDDKDLARISNGEKRILLTRDHQLLMRSIVQHGYWVRATEPRRQLLEVARRYRLAQEMRPFTRCLRCNGALAPVDKADIEHLLEPDTRRFYDAFWRCRSCGRVYWPGSHYARMQGWIQELLAQL
jgi:uncharacterized protein